MAKANLCAGCNTPLVLHCDESKICEHDTYDLRRGILRYRSGQIVRLGA